MLKEYSKTMSSKNTDIEQFQAFLNFYSSRIAQIHEEKSELNSGLRKVESELAKKRASIRIDEESTRKRGVRISVIVLAEVAGEVQISLSYMVSGATWTPIYDLRATIADSEKKWSGILLQYYASILQTTGEDWVDVQLILSTANPLLGTDIPTLEPCYVSRKFRQRLRAKGISYAQTIDSQALFHKVIHKTNTPRHAKT